MNTSNHFFKTAQVCQNGHLRNSDTSTHAAKNEIFAQYVVPKSFLLAHIVVASFAVPTI